MSRHPNPHQDARERGRVSFGFMARVRTLILVICAVQASRLLAGENQWTTSGPPGQVLAIAMDSGPGGTLYAATAKGIYRSSDKAANWKLVGPDLSGYRPATFLAVDPLDPSVLYALAQQFYPSSLWKSVDGGATWNALTNGLPSSYYLRQFAALPGVLYVVADKIYESKDAGTTWSVASTTFPPGNVVFDEQDPNLMYATNDTRFYRSTDGGQNWERSRGDSAFRGYPISSVAVEPGNFSRVYAGLATGAQSALFESTDGGETWALETAGMDLNGYEISAIAVPSENPSIVFASISEPPTPCCLRLPPFGGLFRSVDGGRQWIRLSPKGSGYSLHTDSAGRFLFAATTEGVAVYEVVEIVRPAVEPPARHRRMVLRPFN
jgi:photosystem II stability/assembly factor-like uncharacterized protein